MKSMMLAGAAAVADMAEAAPTPAMNDLLDVALSFELPEHMAGYINVGWTVRR
jgi:hypothetical protein